MAEKKKKMYGSGSQHFLAQVPVQCFFKSYVPIDICFLVNCPGNRYFSCLFIERYLIIQSRRLRTTDLRNWSRRLSENNFEIFLFKHKKSSRERREVYQQLPTGLTIAKRLHQKYRKFCLSQKNLRSRKKVPTPSLKK